MSENSAIVKLVDPRLSEFHGLQQEIVQHAARLQPVQPLLERHILFPAVATRACGSNVVWGCEPSTRNRIQVVYGGRWLAAVDATATIDCYQVVESLRRNRANTSAPHRGLVLTIESEPRVSSVPVSLGGAQVGSTSPSTRLSDRQPLAARTTPGLSPGPSRSPVASSRTDSQTRLSTCGAGGGAPVATRLVPAEEDVALPRRAAVAPLLIGDEPELVFFKATADSRSRCATGPKLRTSHCGYIA